MRDWKEPASPHRHQAESKAKDRSGDGRPGRKMQYMSDHNHRRSNQSGDRVKLSA